MGASGPSAAARAQQRQADQRDRDIQNASAQVNAIFDSPARAQERADYERAVRQREMTDLDQQFGDQNRDLKFAMARSGLTSGSADVDLHDRLNQDYGKGVLQVGAAAKQAGANLQGADEASRSRLLTEVGSGLGLTDANQQALASAVSNREAAEGSIAPAYFDQLLGGYAKVYDQSQIAAGHRQAELANLGTYFNTTPGGSLSQLSSIYY